ncbi:CGNR zinc finger [mine drainage metagenome]|uniref:CGNR zinc finger n=1 Tax=mine drainage metagenome TaxID=410659 RepID=A0A1J5SAY3_9ZZZZ
MLESMAPSFEWLGGHPALDFLNTLDERRSDAPLERLPDYATLVAFVRQARLVPASDAARLAARAGGGAARAAWKTALALRECAYRVVASRASGRIPSEEDLESLNRAFRTAATHRLIQVRLRSTHWIWDQPTALELPVWILSAAIEDLLSHSPADRVRLCHAEDCGVVFVDTSKPGRRRWCSMSGCGNRHKVRRFRAR